MKNGYLYKIGLFCFLGIAIFLTFNKHSKSGYFNYHSELWADKAGYYMYLPAAFKYNFDPADFPDSVDVKTGYGFLLDYQNKKVITRYTYGVSLLQLPFYAIAELLAGPLNFENNGFSPIYHKMINVASVIYLFIGLLFLKKFLNARFNSTVSTLTALSVFLGTNLYYFSIDETGMSHVYSFAMFSIFIYQLQKTKYLSDLSFWKTLFMGFIAGLIFVIRPTNAIFLSTYLFLDTGGLTDIASRIKRLWSPKLILPLLVGAFIAILPQLFYWKYVNDSFIYYSYGEYGFNWANPKPLHVWFNPNNGLFLYSPFYLLVIGGLLLMIRKSSTNAIYILSLFLVLTYIFSSWFAWNFGCSFGARSYIEFLVLFSIPIAWLFNLIGKQSKTWISVFTLVVLLAVFYNIKMTYSFDECFTPHSEWDWNSYLKLLKSRMN